MELRALLIGLGARGREWARELQSHDAWQLAGVIEPDESARSFATDGMGLAADRCHASLERAEAGLDHADAVLVATPPDAHVEPCTWALTHRLPVLVEKPFSTTLRDAQVLVALADEKNVPLLVGQNHRYLRSHRTVRKVVQAGTLGDVRMAIAHYYRVPHDMAASLARLPHRVMWGMGIHHLDALRYVLGKKVTGVFARSYTLPGGDPPEGASFDALLEFDGGTTAQYSATYESSGHEYFEGGQEYYERLVGDRGTLHVINRWLVLSEIGRLPRLVRRGARKVSEESVLLSQFADAIQHGRESECSGRENLQTMATIDACVRSATDKTWIDPQELLNEPR